MSRCLPLQAVFVIQTAEDSRRRDSMAGREPMTLCSARRVTERPFRNAWSQTRMWPGAIVVNDPLPKNRANVPFAHRNDEVQAFAADRAD